MASVNKVTLIGNVGRDPEIRFLPSGDPVASFSMATSESWKGKDGSKQEKTEWHNVSVFGKTAEVCRDYVTKGKQIYIEGTLVYEEWTDKEGAKRITAKVKVAGPNSRLVLLGGGSQRREERNEEPHHIADEDTPF